MRQPRRVAAALLSLAGAALAWSQTPEPQPRPFLRQVIQLNDAQLAAMDKGDVVTKQLPSPDKPEIAAFGVVRIAGTIDTLRERMRDLQAFRKVPQIVEAARFSTPPRIEDLAGLHWEDKDLRALQDCKPGDCDVKGGASALDRIKKEIDWSAPDAKTKASAVVKELMLSYIKAYEAGGTVAMAVTLDKAKPKALADEYRTLLKNSPYLFEYVAPFYQYLESYPKGTLPDVENTFYWTKDTFGLKPVVSMFHATLQRQERGLLVAIKTLYANHYFNAALEVMAAVPTQDGKGFYLLDLYRTRIDPPTGMLGGVLLGKVKGGIEEGVSMNLKNARTRVEGR